MVLVFPTPRLQAASSEVSTVSFLPFETSDRWSMNLALSVFISECIARPPGGGQALR